MLKENFMGTLSRVLPKKRGLFSWTLILDIFIFFLFEASYDLCSIKEKKKTPESELFSTARDIPYGQI